MSAGEGKAEDEPLSADDTLSADDPNLKSITVIKALDSMAATSSIPEKDGGDPSTIHKNLAAIKHAQSDINKLDVLVCGKCHVVFHFVDEFNEHKADPTCSKPAYRINVNESKAQVWAFLLWKSNVGSKIIESELDTSSWGLYKRWCKLDQSVRETWVAAGKAIQVSTMLGGATVKQVTTVLPSQMKKVRDDLFTFTDSLGPDKKVKAPAVMTVQPLTHSTSQTIKKSFKRKFLEVKEELVSEDETNRAQPTQRPKATRSSSLKKKRKTDSAEDDGESSEEENYVVEKILAKRYNQKQKYFEYLLKWEGYPQDQNTWEPISHMQACDKLVETFERNLARQKASHAKLAESGQKVVTKIVQVAGNSELRPCRSSKTRAMENVKSWCGSIAKYTVDDPDDPEFVSDVTRSPPGLLKSLSLVRTHANPSQTLNGVKSNLVKAVPAKVTPAKAETPPILVANSKGVIKVDPKQVPSLSSGVYIVSTQSGTVKVDNDKVLKSQSAKPIAKGSPQSGVMRMARPATPILQARPSQNKSLASTNPRVLGPRGNSPISSSTLAVRPGLRGPPVRSPLTRPPFVPRPPNILRPPTSRLRTPLRSPPATGVSSLPVRGASAALRGIATAALKTASPASRGSPAAQVKSGMKPIQAMLGLDGSSIMTMQVPKKQNTPGAALTASSLLNYESPKSSTPGRLGFKSYRNQISKGKSKPTKVNNNDAKATVGEKLNMEFLEIPAKTPSPLGSPAPLTLCPETGKILARAEGEPSPPPSPEMSTAMAHAMHQGLSPDTQILPDFMPTQEENDKLVADIHMDEEFVTVTRLANEIKDDDISEAMQEGQEYVTITGEDGVIYQIATNGQDLVEGQTMVMTQDGEQQCVYVTSQESEDAVANANQLTLDNAVAEAVSQLLPGVENQIIMTSAGGGQILMTTEGSDEGTMAQVVAQVIEGGVLLPGCMRKVVLLLPDGNFMMTEVDEEQYIALDLDK